ncbi:hypothetical protein CCYA_CCYA01G0113 [Cyanidiococcus yangmingshanensis]|nr:hypothetical protein CCYA_CCYA01G0113 [Cyanidiococcus yangmingshanensis]
MNGANRTPTKPTWKTTNETVLSEGLVRLHAAVFGLLFGNLGGVRQSLPSFQRSATTLRKKGQTWIPRAQIEAWLRQETDWLEDHSASSDALQTSFSSPIRESSGVSGGGDQGTSSGDLEQTLQRLVHYGVLIASPTRSPTDAESSARTSRPGLTDVAKAPDYAIAYLMQNENEQALNTLLRLPESLRRSARLPARTLALQLERILDTLLSVMQPEDGQERAGMRYEAVYAHPAFAEWLATATLLAWCRRPDDSLGEYGQKLGFYCNIFNCMVIQAVIQQLAMRAPKTASRFPDATDLLRRTRLIFSGELLTLSELRDQVIRSGCQQQVQQPRNNDKSRFAPLALTVCDPRIHFVLNWGARSSAPPRTIHLMQWESDFDSATKAFLLNPYYVYVPVNVKQAVQVSRLFEWFREDFAPAEDDDIGVLRWIQAHLPEDSSAEKSLRERLVQAGAGSRETAHRRGDPEEEPTPHCFPCRRVAAAIPNTRMLQYMPFDARIGIVEGDQVPAQST